MRIPKEYPWLSFRNVAIFGLIFCLAITTYVLLTSKYQNFMIFQLSTFDFWNGISPYCADWFRHGYDYYLYSPVFNVLFTPFAYLPTPVGLFVWNLFNYLLLVYAIKSFPRITDRQKAYTLLFILPILAPAMMNCQYNLAVAAIYVLGFSLMEKGRPVAAVLVMMLSGVTKIYGLAELSILLFYPRVWRNIGWALLIGAILALLPLVRYSFAQYADLLAEWIAGFASHKASREWETIYDVSIFARTALRYELMPYIQVGVFAVLSICVLVKRKLWANFEFRIGVVALMMGWCILFGNSSETHTYLISVLGFLLWYHISTRRTLVDKVLYWSVFLVIVLIPIDLIFPAPVWHFVYRTLDLNKWLMLVLWLYMTVQILRESRYHIVRKLNY